MIKELFHSMMSRLSKVTAPSLIGRAGGESAILLFILLLVACSSDSPSVSEGQGEHAIGFSAYLAEGEEAAEAYATRAAGDGELTTEGLRAGGFGVYCWYTGTDNFTTPKPTSARDGSPQPYTMLMRNQKVEYISDAWNYSPSKYWPMDPNEKLTFRAYAPYTDYLLTDNSTGMPKLPVVVAATDYHNGTQHDPLWGTGKRGGADDDGTTYGLLYNNYTWGMSGDETTNDNRDGIIDWYFHHGMSKLMFSISVIQDPGCDMVTITGITITPLYNQGLLDLSSPTASSSEKPIWTEPTGNMTVNLTEATPNTNAGDLAPAPAPNPSYPFAITTSTTEVVGPYDLLSQGLLIIPRDYRSTPMEVTITYTIDNDSAPLTATGTINRDFEGNTAYAIGLSLTPSTKGLEITLVQSAFTRWVEGGTGAEVVHNW